jgi:hypothetical protein
MTGLGEARYLDAHTRSCVIRTLEAQESEYQLNDKSYESWILDVPEDLTVAVTKAHGLVMKVRTNTSDGTST